MRYNPRVSGLGRALLSCVLCGLLIGCRSELTDKSRPGPEEIDRALEDARAGEVTKAIGRLQAVVEAYPSGRLGDRAALILGNLLITRRRHGDAILPLRRAAKGSVGPQYARLLMSRAVVDGGLSAQYHAALEHLELQLDGSSLDVRPLVRQEARYLLVKLLSSTNRWQEAADAGLELLKLWPECRYVDEVRWLTSEALRHQHLDRDAMELYEKIWYETPGSPWAVEAETVWRE